jgi:hypothetical protein
MRLLVRGWALLLPAVLCGIGACDDEPPGCRAAQTTALPTTALTALADVRLHRVGDDFALSGYDAPSGTVRFARLSAAGQLGPESSLMLPAPALGPFFAPVGKTAAGDQLLIAYGVAGAQAQVTMQIQVLEAIAGHSGKAPPRPLTDGKGGAVVLAPGADRSALQVAFGGSASGMRAAFAWGRGDRPSVPELVLLKGDGEAEPPPDALGPSEATWDCLAITRGRAAFGVSWVGRAGEPVWHLADMRDDTSIAYSLDVQLPTPDIGCPTSAPTRSGYTLAWQNRDGTYFSHVDTSRDPVMLVSDIVKAAVRFGGPDRQPRIACIAPMGKEFGIVYDATSGPTVDRFNIFGNPLGSSLRLPTSGRTESTAAWPAIDALFLTYLDRGRQLALDRRMFVRIECPQI